MTVTSVFAPIFKSQEQDDGSLMIYGKATGSDLDLDQQRCDPDWLKQAMPRWFGTGEIGDVGGNIRMQHDPKSAVGKAHGHDVKEDGHYIRAHIVDPIAVTKVKAGVFTGLSIGISKPVIEKTATDEWIRGGDISEISVCDRPCLPTAVFTMCKAAKPGMSMKSDDFDSQRMLVRVEEYVEKSVEPDMRKVAGDPEMQVTLADRLSPEQVEKLTSVTEEKGAEPDAEKATDVDHTDAPAAGQTCVRCSEPGHLWCAPEGFDKDFAVGLVGETVEKASKGDGLGQDEGSDISGAEQAIAAIATLIISEAQDLASMPSQDCDIHLLMSAVDALRIFACREKLEQGAIDPDSVLMMSAAPDVEKSNDSLLWFAVGPDAIPVSLTARGELVKAKYTADELRQMLKDGKAFENPNGEPSYPIGDKADLKNAIDAVGRGSGDHDAIRAYIVRRAGALDANDLIPDSWTSSGSNDSGKSVESETEKTVSVETAESTETVEKKYTLDEARAELAKAIDPGAIRVIPEIEKAAEPGTVRLAPEVVKADVDAEKAVTPETTKAAVEEDTAPDGDALVKALTASLEKADSPLRKTFMGIVEASTKTIAETLEAQGERLVKVESMATPNGPALRRTEIETKTAQKSDLLRQAQYWATKSETTEDRDLRRGYAANATSLRERAEALSF